MNFTHLLQRAQAQNQSLLCVGLDPDPVKFPAHLQGDASRIYDFCAAIVDATADLVIAFKLKSPTSPPTAPKTSWSASWPT